MCEMKGHAEAVASTCAVETVTQTLVATSVDGIDRALVRTEQMERVWGSLDVDDVETPGRGEDLYISLSPKREGIFLYTSLQDRH
jgi:hypothetical protein